MMKRLAAMVLLFALCTSSRGALAQDFESNNHRGFYFDTAPSALAPYSGKKLLDFLGTSRLRDGMQTAIGFISDKIGLGLKLRFSSMAQDDLANFARGINGAFDQSTMYGVDLESKIFVRNLFDDSQSKLVIDSWRPYLLVGTGYGLINDSASLFNGTYSGYEGNFGLGMQWEPIPTLRLGVESAYRPLLFGSECVATNCHNPYVHTFNVAVNIGFQF